LDLSGGAKCADGTSLNPTLLVRMAEAYTIQLNRDYSAEHGGNFSVRAGSSSTDLVDGEYPFAFLPALTDAPGAIADHTNDGNGMPLLFDGVTLSDTVNGPGNSCTVAGSHEVLETGGDEGCNLNADRFDGTEVAKEVCDFAEAQTYPITCADGTVVWVSDFALRAWLVPGRPGPYSYAARAGLNGAIDAPAPLVTVPGRGYQVVRRYDPTSQQAVNGYVLGVEGERVRRPLDLSTRAKLRLMHRARPDAVTRPDLERP
jgi:hypothetical protein